MSWCLIFVLFEPYVRFHDPTSKKMKGHIGLGLSIEWVQCQSVTLSTRSGTIRARILKFGMWFHYENS